MRYAITFGQIQFIVQLLMAESMFLYVYNKRRFFLPRLLFGIAAAIVLSVIAERLLLRGILWPVPRDPYLLQLLEFIRILSQIAITVAAAKFCFREGWWTLISACMAGYAVQHFAFNAERLLELFVPLRQMLERELYSPVLMAIFLLIYLFFFFALARPFAKRGYKNNGDSRLNTLSFVVILTLVVLNRVLALAGTPDLQQSIVNRLYGMAFCLFALLIQYGIYRQLDTLVETVTVKALLQQSAQQYEQWKASIDQINIRYHDLRHEVDFLKEMGQSQQLQEIKEALDDRDMLVRTGNEALDILIAGKKLLCRKEGIRLVCAADNGVLSGFNEADIYSLFTNAIDNGIESLKAVEDESLRLLSIVVRRKGNAAVIEVENYFDGKLTLSDGLPVTNKPELWHGYGLKSMKGIAEKYGGVMVITTKDQKFCLSFLLPIPSK